MSYGMDGWCKEIYTQPYKGKLTDYIKREDAIKALCKSKCYPGVLCPDEYCVEVRRVFDDIPAAQPERKRGHWSNSCCSVCGLSRYNFVKLSHIDAGYRGTWKYCPNCGAEMEVSK